jgi:general secretion pathway protein D
MGRKSDIEAIKQVIASLDVMLEQVMIEAVILSVGLNDTLDTGVQWVYDTQSPLVKQNATGFNPAKVLANTNATATGVSKMLAQADLSYYGVIPKLDMQALITATKSDSNTRILSTPVVMTTDNTEAKITVSKEYPVVSSSINSGSGTTTDGYSARATYQYRSIGITLTVTPNINPQGFVVMEITQTADDPSSTVKIDNNEVPVISKREIKATVAVQDRSTIVLGGLVQKNTTKSASKIPILGDIPLLGWLFSTRGNSDDRTELVVLLTPYVLTTPEQAQNEAKRIYKASDSKDTLWPRGWSQSPLRNDEPAKDDWKKKKGKKDKATGEEPTNTVPVAVSDKMPTE